jgi:hypothetical protein
LQISGGSDGEDNEFAEEDEDDEFEEQEDEEASLNATSSWSEEDDIWAVSDGFRLEQDHDAGRHEAPHDPVPLDQSRSKRKLTIVSGQSKKKIVSSPAARRRKITEGKRH